ncbi:MAG: DUF473 family protein [Candidatus Methanofastidiosia archaeon]
MYALTSVSKKVLKELITHRVTTLELRNADNINVLLKLSVGDLIFITSKCKEDVISGTTGVVAKIKALNFSKQKISLNLDEFETSIGRVQLEVVGNARIMGSDDKGFCRGIEVGVEELVYYEAS